MKRLRLVIINTLLASLLWPAGSVFAASYNVSASVPYTAPSQAAVINSALNNLTVQNAAFLLSGTCQSMTPPTVISVIRGATLLGSQSCTSGTFSLQISLAEGLNTLVVRTTNVSSLYGPDSSPISVTLHTPATPLPTPITPEVSTPQRAATPGATNLPPAENNSFNTGARSGLNIVPQEPFSVLPDTNLVSLSFVIGGGSTPYTVELNWGDGSTDTRVVNDPGVHTFTHQYRNTGNYTVKGRVRDVLGASTEISYAVVATKVVDQKLTVARIEDTSINPVVRWFQQHWVAATIGSAVVVVTGAAFWLGQHAGLQTALSSSGSTNKKSRTIRKTPKTKPRGKR